ncbi:hypothetical protein [Salmonirosea aquatica]|uniref:Uncharacterized protein n=1 Tax=Salmonirosea aquatica TaxID=2654236 RepID=A0A7C9BIN1_9BACT|nr:hypothetical protein [Cytophagaceae bacterium SJW1-29]
MKKLANRVLLTLLFTAMTLGQGWAQCAMCRGTVESTMGNGRNNVGIGLNTGIMYLFVMPYIIVAVIAYLWYRNSKKARDEQRLVASRVQQAMDR